MSRPRAGAAMVEVITACLVGVLLAGLSLGSLVRLRGTTQGQADRSAMVAQLRTSSQVLFSELRLLGPEDVVVLGPDGVVYRAVRGAGHGCGLALDGLVLPTGSFQAVRVPVAGRDSLEVLGGTSGPAPVWVRLAVAGPVRSALCPDGSTAIALPLEPLALLDGVDPGAPVRLFEVMELRGYRSDGRWWLGARSVSAGEAIQPFAGPFEVAPGFRWIADSAGNPAGIELVLDGNRSAHPEAQGGAARGAAAGRDTLRLRVRFRNPAGS